MISYTLQVRPYRHAELRARQGSHPKAKLKSEADAGVVLVGEDVRLTDLPVEA
jgi:hypothetical protein